jgi:microsomal dipeptidase-like Zn-dependent dipeptidase
VSLGLDFIEGWGDEEKVNLRAHADAFGTCYDFPTGLEGVARLPNLTRGLLARGHDDDVVTGILGANLLGFLARAWA